MFRVQRSVKGLPSYSVNSVPRPLLGGVPGATAKLCGHFCQNIALFRQACFKNTFMKERIFYFSGVGKTSMYFMLSFVLFLKEVKTKTLQKKRKEKKKATPIFKVDGNTRLHSVGARGYHKVLSFPSPPFLSPFPFLLPLSSV